MEEKEYERMWKNQMKCIELTANTLTDIINLYNNQRNAKVFN
jgi:hypothetical protein